MAISFKDRVVIVTGAGAGLGRAHALEFARRGAKVVVNDLGGKVDGSGGSSDAALKVVEEIKALGAEAIANGASVSDRAGAESIVNDAISKWGRIDAVVNNAGILRDKSFVKMELDDFELVVRVHLLGSVYVTKAAWPHFINQKYGRVVLTTSSSGLYGNFGQSNYGAAKLGLVGFMNTLKIEGQKNNVFVNTIAPVAATRMTEGLGIPEEVMKQLKPELISSAVVFLASQDAPNGTIIEAGAGYFAKAQIVEGKGVKLGQSASVDDVAAAFEKITDMSEAKPHGSGTEIIGKIFTP
jgi:NAD(P)-dependent dehydrogenase (short-subunit alcohol dehydrogenase family)